MIRVLGEQGMVLWWARIETNLNVQMELFSVAARDGDDVVSSTMPLKEHFR